ncbi:FRG domain-containing protein [Bordetella bronchialis]|uniref:FRG domain-containing protein n=1 Tax=Bordetella bronchialis TaxID=463025 RepID=A0A193FF11_9BORD|nr:FRG domain-containing protein [Bordetella bronchialis]ANN65699.1 hypothetical protein BAU06_04790 [Bordetella bronchialis]ANN70729.1 hypothetical protein BAU08_04760 [Bordetella bronchialis]
METITEYKLWSFTGESPAATVVQRQDYRKAAAYPVDSYFDLATKIAALQFHNRDHILLFRGQAADHRNRAGYTSLKPTLLRGSGNRNPSLEELRRRFARLIRAEKILAEEYLAAGLLGLERVGRHRIVRWAILQHYEICATPLLDVTHSLRVAASFASHGSGNEGCVFVLGVPYLSGGITVSAEAGLQTVRLSSVCPPSAVRPHLQEGYLLGEYPEMSGIGQKALYLHHEMDFGRRLIAKFRFDPARFWEGHSFPLVGKQALYPSDDPMLALARRVKEKLALQAPHAAP